MVKLNYKNSNKTNKINSGFNYLFLTILLIFYILFIPLEASAGVFDPPITDRSVEYLGMIFGNNIGGLHLGTSVQTSGFLGNLFEKLNGIVVAIATVVLLYTSILSTINTAQDGEIMGKKWSSIWIPLRSSMGLLLLAPIPGSGYSLIQVTVMWIVLNGIGAADTIWNLVADSISSGINVVQNQNNDVATTTSLLETGKNLGGNMLRSLVCVGLLNKYIPPDVSGDFLGGIARAYVTEPKEEKGKLTGYLKFGYESASDGYTAMQDICGSITMEVGPSIESDIKKVLENPSSLTAVQKNTIKKAVFEIKQTALTSMIGSINDLANTIANLQDDPDILNKEIPELINNPGILSSGVLSFQGIMSGLTIEQLAIKLGLKIKASAQNLPENFNIEKVKATGWIMAGAYYYTFNQKNIKSLLETTTKDLPSINMIGNGIYKGTINVENSSINMLELPNFNENKSKYYIYYKNLNNENVNKLFEVPGQVSDLSSNDDFIPSGSIAILGVNLIILNPIVMTPFIIFLGGINVIIKDLVNLSDTTDPIIVIANAGQKMMLSTEILWLWLIRIMLLISVLLGMLAGCVSPAISFLTYLLTVITVIIGILIMIWGLGALLGVYIPLVPFMIFAVTAMGWFISVVEAIVAAPLVALGIILPSQEELGTVKHALEMVTNIFLKPMLIIIGLVLSGKVFKVLLIFVTSGFKNTTIILNNPSLFSWLCVLWIYAGFVIALVNKSYSLIYHLPDRVLSWIGVSGGSTDISIIDQAKAHHEQVTAEVKNTQATTADDSKNLGNLIGSKVPKKINHFGGGGSGGGTAGTGTKPGGTINVGSGPKKSP